MAREPRVTPDEAFQCVEPFSVWRNGIPEVYGQDKLVLGDDPVLRTHRAHFRPVVDRVTRTRGPIEQATSAPGELRAPVTPAISRTLHVEENPDG